MSVGTQSGTLPAMTVPNPKRPIRIDNLMWDQLVELAAEDGNNAAEQVRQAIEMYLRRRKRFAGRYTNGLMEMNRRGPKENQ